MSASFSNGYALLIGVSEQLNPNDATPLSATANDVGKLANVLLDPEICGYKEENVTILVGAKTKRINIFKELIRLSKQLEKNPESTVLVYFSGHGYLKKSTGKYYLIPYDFDLIDVEGAAMEDSFFAEKLGALNTNRLLLLLDTCHSGETDASAIILEEFERRAAEVSTFLPRHQAKIIKDAEEQEDNPDNSKPIKDAEEQEDNPDNSKPIKNSPLVKDEDATIAVLSSSKGSELSWIHKEAKLSIFTYHLIEALNGHGKTDTAGKEKFVTVFDVMKYLTGTVAKTAEKQHNASQRPFFNFRGDDAMEIAVLRGGAGIPEGSTPPNPESLIQQLSNITIEVAGNGNIIVDTINGDNVRGDKAGVHVIKSNTIGDNADFSITNN